MKKLTLVSLTAGTLLNAAATAAPPVSFTIGSDHRTVTVPSPLNSALTPFHRPAGAEIFDNLATLDPKGVYTVGSGAGFGNVDANSPPVELATAFTAPTTIAVTEIDVGAGFISGAQNLVRVHLYHDAGGVPGTEIWARATALPIDGTCCAVAVLKTQGVKLKAGQQYWLSLGIAKRAPDTFAAWYGNVADQVDAGLTAINQGSGWTASPTVPLPAFGVFGK